MAKYFMHRLARREADEIWFPSHMLVELTPAERREIEARQGPALDRYDALHASEAHRWVKDGGLHSTGLYTDEGRIRYARDGY